MARANNVPARTSRRVLHRQAARSCEPKLGVETWVAAIRALVRELPAEMQREVARRLVRDLRQDAPKERTRMYPGEAENEADMSVEILSQDERVRQRTAAWTRARWKKLVKCFHLQVLKKLQLLEKRTFPSEQAMDQAIGDAVVKTVAQVAKDPDLWDRKHCRKKPKKARPPRKQRPAAPTAPR